MKKQQVLEIILNKIRGSFKKFPESFYFWETQNNTII